MSSARTDFDTPGSGFNVCAATQNPELDRLLRQVSRWRAVTQPHVHPTTRKIQQIIHDDVPYVFISGGVRTPATTTAGPTSTRAPGVFTGTSTSGGTKPWHRERLQPSTDPQSALLHSGAATWSRQRACPSFALPQRREKN
jgi:hypothetical protein